VETPLVWAFRRILFNRTKYFWWHKVKWIMALCVIWAVLFSVLNLWHVLFRYDDLDDANEKFERDIRTYELPLSSTQANSLTTRFKEYADSWLVSDFFGAGQLEKYALDRYYSAFDLVDYDKVDTVEETKSGSGGGWSSQTQAARKDYNKIADRIEKVPVTQQRDYLTSAIEELWAAHDPESDSMNPGFVQAVERNVNRFESDMDAFLDTFSLLLEIEGLQEWTQVEMRIGSNEPKDFSNIPPRFSPEGVVRGEGGETVHFEFRRFKPPGFEPLQEVIDNPHQDFYPRLRSGAFILNFGRDYGLKVRLKGGTMKPPPELRKL
jgi:hypothetical protein